MSFLRNVKKTMIEFESFKVNIIDYILVGILSALASLFIVSGPIALSINLIILVSNLRIFISFVLAFIFAIFIYFLVFFYMKSISKGNLNGIKGVSLFYSIIFLIFGIILVVILIMIGVY